MESQRAAVAVSHDEKGQESHEGACQHKIMIINHTKAALNKRSH